MTRTELDARVARLGVRFCPHTKAIRMRIFAHCARLRGVDDWIDEYWLTWGKTIFHPASVTDPLADLVQIGHELVHVKQQAGTWLYWWFLRYLTSWRFRWQEEREAYLINVRASESIEGIAITLRTDYAIRTPADDMTQWFERNKGWDPLG